MKKILAAALILAGCVHAQDLPRGTQAEAGYYLKWTGTRYQLRPLPFDSLQNKAYVTGYDVYIRGSRNRLRTLVAGTNVTMSTTDSTLTINASPGGGGISTLNTLTASTQTFAVGTSGSDFNISSVTSTHTFNLPTASASVRGALSSADWSTFNAKEPALSAGTTGQFYRGDKSWSNTLVGDLYAENAILNDASQPFLRIATGGSSTNYTQIRDDATSEMTFTKIAFTGDVSMHLYPNSAGGTGALEISLFRYSGTSGTRRLNIYKGDATSTVMAYIDAATGGAYLAALGTGTVRSTSGVLSSSASDTVGLAANLFAKAPKASPTFTGTITTPLGAGTVRSSAGGVLSATASDTVGLAAALFGKEPTISAGTTGQFYRGDEGWSNTLVGNFYAENVIANASSQPLLRAAASGSSTNYTQIMDASTSESYFTKIAFTGDVAMHIYPNSAGGTGALEIGLFRYSSSSGSRTFNIYKGDGTATITAIVNASTGALYLSSLSAGGTVRSGGGTLSVSASDTVGLAAALFGKEPKITTLGTDRGGTGLTTNIANTIPVFDGTGTTASYISAAAGTGYVLRSSSPPSWGKVQLSGGTIDVSGTLGNTLGGTGTATAFTQGSVVYAGASGVYSQNNSGLYFSGTNLGVGTNSPALTGTAPFIDLAGTGLRIRQSRAPASTSAAGYTGEICWSYGYLYVCVAGDGPGGSTDSWMRVAVATW